MKILFGRIFFFRFLFAYNGRQAMRLFISILFCCIGAMCFAQPSYLLHKSYALKCIYLDSFLRTLNYSGATVAEINSKVTGLVNWAKTNGDQEFADEIEVMGIKRIMTDDRNSVLKKRLDDLSSYANKKKDYYLEANTLKYIGDYWGMEKKYGLRFEYYLAAYKVYADLPYKEFPPKKEYLYLLGLDYLQYGDNESALKVLTEANVATGIRNDYSNSVINALGMCYRNISNYDSAAWYFQKVYDIAVNNDDKQWIGISAGNIGICYYSQKKYDQAIPLLEKDIEISMATTQVQNAVRSMYILADIYFIQNNPVKSEEILKRALAIGEPRKFWPNYQIAASIFRLLSKIYVLKNDMRDAYLYADSTLTAKDSVAANYNALSLAKVNEKMDMIQHKLDVEQLSSQKKIQELTRDCIVGGIFLLTVIAVLFINRQRLKQKKLVAEKKNSESELDTATQLLDNFRQSIQEKNSIIEHFTSDITRMKTEAVREIDNDALTKLEQSIILTDEQWENFRLLFEKVHKGFFASLKKKMPDLTQAEIRFLALTKLKLSSKEMAAMLGISANAIRIYRHRLRRKLDLDKDDMIEELVEKI
jgi:DNA-binding CsgD family transcriptional regulator